VGEEASGVRAVVIAEETSGRDRAATQGELGGLLFADGDLTSLAKVGPALELNQATDKFVTRFREVERLARARGLPLPGTALGRLDGIWDEVKRRERWGGGAG